MAREIKVSSQTKTPTVKFSRVGDSMTGIFKGLKPVKTKFGEKSVANFLLTDGSETLITTVGRDVVDVEPGTMVSMFPTDRLLGQLKEAKTGSVVTIELIGFIDTGKGNPMKDFRVLED